MTTRRFSAVFFLVIMFCSLLYGQKTIALVNSSGEIGSWQTDFSRYLKQQNVVRRNGYTVINISLGISQNMTDEQRQAVLAYLNTQIDANEVDILFGMFTVASEFIARHIDSIHDVQSIVYALPPEDFTPPVRSVPSQAVLPSLAGEALTQNLSLMRQLFPTRRHLVLVSGAHPSDESYAALARQRVGVFGQFEQVRELIGLTYDELANAFSDLGDDDVVMITSLSMDRLGSRYKLTDILPDLSQASAAPIFGMYDNLSERGAIGGVMTSVTGYAQKAGMLLEQLSEGPTDPGGESITGLRTILDIGEIQRWNVARRLIPPGAEIVGRGNSAFLIDMVAVIIALGTVALLLIALPILRFFRRSEARRLEMLAKEVDGYKLRIREMNHRVKNNFQMLSSYLSVKELFGEREDYQLLIPELKSHVNLLSSLQNDLSLDDLDESKESSQLFQNFISDLQGYGKNNVPDLEVEAHIDPIELPNGQIMPLCYILSELILNTLKYAFPEYWTGEKSIQINIRLDSDGRVHLEYSDSGAGLSQASGEGQGSRIIRGMVDQLNGDFEVMGRNGYHFSMSFPTHSSPDLTGP